MWQEMVTLDAALEADTAHGVKLESLLVPQVAEGKSHPCLFEYIYISRPDSIINGIHVYAFQLGLGSRLAKRIRLVVGATIYRW